MQSQGPANVQGSPVTKQPRAIVQICRILMFCKGNYVFSFILLPVSLKNGDGIGIEVT